jgi:hypothetical protein
MGAERRPQNLFDWDLVENDADCGFVHLPLDDVVAVNKQAVAIAVRVRMGKKFVGADDDNSWTLVGKGGDGHTWSFTPAQWRRYGHAGAAGDLAGKIGPAQPARISV